MVLHDLDVVFDLLQTVCFELQFLVLSHYFILKFLDVVRVQIKSIGQVFDLILCDFELLVQNSELRMLGAVLGVGWPPQLLELPDLVCHGFYLHFQFEVGILCFPLLESQHLDLILKERYFGSLIVVLQAQHLGWPSFRPCWLS